MVDLASAAYFSVASLYTYASGDTLFVDHSGSIGYFVLSLTAICSIASRQPFTLEAARRDWPKSYWEERSFIVINYAVSAVWASIFTVNAILYLLASPYRLAVSSALVAFGMAFSVAFPVKASEYLVTRQYVKPFSRFDWSVSVDPHRARGDDEYDVIVVGAGVGGLTCAALLATRGYRVLVLEQQHQVGGYCSSFRRGGFVFNSGVEDVSGLWERGPVLYLLRRLGLDRDRLFVRNTVRYVYRGSSFDVRSLSDVVESLSRIFPGERERLVEFFRDASMAYEECYSDVEPYGTPLPPELIAKVFGRRKLVNYPREHPHFYDWMRKTFKQKLDEYFADEELKGFLSALLAYVGTRPEETQASAALTACVSYYLHGGYFPRGGAQHYANTLRDAIERYGGRVLLGHKVDRIVVEGGAVKGVRVGSRVFYSPIVVSNVNARTTFLELVGEENLDRGFADYVRGLRMSPSCFMVFLGVDMDLSGYPTIIKNLDEGYEVVVNSNADPSLAPEGKASVTILTSASYSEFPPRGTEGYLRKKAELARALVKKAERVIPGLGDRIVVLDAATPRTLERYTSMPEGALYAFDQSVGTRRPYFKTPIKGLYLVGASTFPGGGIEAVTISGIICANDICGWRV